MGPAICLVSSRLTPDFWEWSLVDMRRLGDPLRWLEGGEFLGRCATVEREGEAFVVVSALPAPGSFSGRLEVLVPYAAGSPALFNARRMSSFIG
jgi:hypothetical protein